MSQELPLPDVDVPLYLHAELLPNIRQITLYVSFPQSVTLDGVHPEIHLLDSCQTVRVTLPRSSKHASDTIQLPARISDASRRIFNINSVPGAITSPRPKSGSQCNYSFRMQIDTSNSAFEPWDELVDSYIPWTAADMSCSTLIRCRACGASLLKDQWSENHNVEADRIIPEREWKDLPSGNWAEMMDFWHCHKPDPHQDDSKLDANAALQIEDQNAQIKGYGASSRVTATSGVVLIDVATFLLAESDCINLEKVRSIRTPIFTPGFPFQSLLFLCWFSTRFLIYY